MRIEYAVSLLLIVACSDPTSISGAIGRHTPLLNARPKADVCNFQDDIGRFTILSSNCPVGGFADETDIIRYSVQNDCQMGFGCVGKTVVATYEFRYHADGIRYGVKQLALHAAPEGSLVTTVVRPKYVRESSAVKIVGYVAGCVVTNPNNPPDNEMCFSNRTATFHYDGSSAALHEELFFSVDNENGYYLDAADVFARAPIVYATIDAASTNESPVAALAIMQMRALNVGGACSTWSFIASDSRAYSHRYESQALHYTFEFFDSLGTLVERHSTANSTVTRDFCPGIYNVRLAVEDAAGGVDGTNPIRFEPYISDQPPIASFAYSCLGLSCSFDGTASSDDHGIQSWEWDLAGVSANGAAVSTTFPGVGTYPVRLTVFDQRGQSASRSESVAIAAPAPLSAEIYDGPDSAGRETTCTWYGAGAGGVPPYRATWYRGINLKTTQYVLTAVHDSLLSWPTTVTASTESQYHTFWQLVVTDAQGARATSAVFMTAVSDGGPACPQS